MDIIGHVDGLVGKYISGWAATSSDDTNCKIELISETGLSVASGWARRDRRDLAGLNLGRTDFGFRILVADLGSYKSLRVLANGTELPNSPLSLGSHAYDGSFSIVGDRAVGWVCRRNDSIGSIEVVVRSADHVVNITGTATENEIDDDVYFKPRRFDIELSSACFNRSDLLLEATVDEQPFGYAHGRLTLVGYIDVIDPGHCEGWLLCPEAPDHTFKVEVWRDCKLLGVAVCDRPREDLRDSHPGNWKRGFLMTFPLQEKLYSTLSSYSFRLPGSTAELFDGPFLAGHRAAFVSTAKRIASLVHRQTVSLSRQDLGLLQTIMRDYLVQHRHGKDYRWDSSLISASSKPERPITILIPIYKGIEITEACIRSVLRNYGPTDTVLLVADCPPEGGMVDMLLRFRNTDRVVLLQNDTNLGFVESVNRGLDYSKSDDILLLNSDTYMFGGAIDQMRERLHSAEDIATVTAMSNNATIFSYPHPSLPTTYLDDIGWEELASLALEVNAGQTVDVPTGHGFCMLVRREVLDRLNGLNIIFGRGYGEENELCLRASDLGFRHVAATGVLVEHRESVSFGLDKFDLITKNLKTLSEMYPEYTPTVMGFEASDPLREGRWRLDVARLHRTRTRGRTFVLIIENWLGGGTVKAERDIGRLVGYGGRDEMRLQCDRDGTVILSTKTPVVRSTFLSGDSVMLLEMLDAADIDLVLIHQLLGFNLDFTKALADWVENKRSYYYGHDFYAMCPRVTFVDATQTFCGGAKPDVCHRCLKFGKSHEASALSELDILSHRDLFTRLLRNVTQVITPSNNAREYFGRFFPDAAVVVIPHPDEPDLLPARPRAGRSDNVILLGGIGPHKGSRQLLEIAAQARLTHQHLCFTVIGHTDIDMQLLELGNVRILGRYDPVALPHMLDRVGGRLALFLSCWPETFSYTLSEAVNAGLVPFVPDIGAPAERVRAAGYGVIFGFPIKPLAVLDAIENYDYDRIQPDDAARRFANPGSIEKLEALLSGKAVALSTREAVLIE